MLYGRKDRQNNRRNNMGASEVLHKEQIRKEGRNNESTR